MNPTDRVLTFQLPWPPSVNSLWRRDPATGRTLLSKAARAYQADAGWIVRSQRCRSDIRFPLLSRLSVTLTYHRGDGRRYDIDNVAKLLIDLLQHCGLIVNDQQIDRLLLIRGAVKPGEGSVCVEIEEMPHG